MTGPPEREAPPTRGNRGDGANEVSTVLSRHRCKTTHRYPAVQQVTPSLAVNPTVVAQLARLDRVGLDNEKSPTCRFAGFRYRGVWLSSRYAKGHELATMRSVLDWLVYRGAGGLIPLISAFDCDSKATRAYSVDITHSDRTFALAVAWATDAALLTVSDGHNGLIVQCGSTELADVDPNWPEPEFGGAA